MYGGLEQAFLRRTVSRPPFSVQSVFYEDMCFDRLGRG